MEKNKNKIPKINIKNNNSAKKYKSKKCKILSEIMHLHITTIMFIIFEHINKIFTQGIPISPCPKMFQYRFDGSEWFGILSVRNPDFGQALHLRVTLSMRGKPTTVSI